MRFKILQKTGKICKRIKRGTLIVSSKFEMIYFAIVAGIVACTGVTLCEATCGELYGK